MFEEHKIPDYHFDEDIRKETNTEKLETEKLSESFLPLALTPASSDLKNSINSNKSQQIRKSQIPKSSNPIKNQSTKNEETSLPIPPKKSKKTQIPSSSSCSQCGLNSNLCLCVYQLRHPLPKACYKEIVRQTESNNREDKIAKFAGKTFFCFVSEAVS